MAVQWLENNQTDITSNQWAETIYGVKATNVFGLAWNYYTAYTKFITGLDITLDLGGKCEFVFGATIKIGYANELATWGDVKTGLNKKKVEIAAAAQTLVASSEEVVETRTSAVEEENVLVENRLVVIGQDVEEREALISVTTGTESRTTSALIWIADDFGFQASATFNVNAPAVYLNGALVEIG